MFIVKRETKNSMIVRMEVSFGGGGKCRKKIPHYSRDLNVNKGLFFPGSHFLLLPSLTPWGSTLPFCEENLFLIHFKIVPGIFYFEDNYENISFTVRGGRKGKPKFCIRILSQNHFLLFPLLYSFLFFSFCSPSISNLQWLFTKYMLPLRFLPEFCFIS